MSPLTTRHAEVEVGVRAGAYRTMVVVSARKEKSNFIIGADIWAVHDCYVLLGQKPFTVGEHQVECIPEWV